MKLLSSAFENNQKIPSKYTCDGENVNPPLIITDVPKNAESLVLIVDDPDAPMGMWNHWIVFNIDPSIKEISENSVPNGGIEVENSGQRAYYEGPCPPQGTHRYFFKLYALDIKLTLDRNITKDAVENAIKNHVLDKAELIGVYNRS